ncbi:MAG: hypothetical protein K5884_09620 [Ruminococcus sp.]|nr:hypothetical protein [Ruminococcus sp.]
MTKKTSYGIIETIGGFVVISPQFDWGAKELKAIRLERKTSFDYNKLAVINCKNNQKEIITK